jgi:hypothetical protein
MANHVTVDGLPRTMFYEKHKPNPEKYANNCPGKKDWQKHHILPCTSVKKSIVGAKTAHLDKALKYFTSWNINLGYNLLPMPTRKAYQNAYGKKGGKAGGVMPSLSVPAALGSPGITYSNLPCHQPTSWGHTVYNVDVKADLISIWAKVKMTIKNHKLNANDVSSDINATKDVWKASLETGRVGSQANWHAMQHNIGKAYNNFTMVDLPSSPV